MSVPTASKLLHGVTANKLLQALNDVEDSLNILGGGSEREEVVKDFFARTHRTLQQQFFKVIILPILRQLSDQYVNKWTDARNEAAAELAHKMMTAIEDENQNVPLI